MSKDGVEVATKRTWLRTDTFPETFAFDLTRNIFVRILKTPETNNEFRPIQTNNLVMTANLPVEFRFEVALKLGASTVTNKYQNILTGKCFVECLNFLTYIRVKISKYLKALEPNGNYSMTLGLWDPKNLKISGHLFGNSFNYDARLDLKDDLKLISCCMTHTSENDF